MARVAAIPSDGFRSTLHLVLQCTEVRPSDPCISIRFRLGMQFQRKNGERRMHLDRKSDLAGQEVQRARVPRCRGSRLVSGKNKLASKQTLVQDQNIVQFQPVTEFKKIAPQRKHFFVKRECTSHNLINLMEIG